MIKQNRDLFAEKDTDLGRAKTIEIKIDNGDHLPINLKPYWIPFSRWQKVSKVINKMLAANIIHQSKFDVFL